MWPRWCEILLGAWLIASLWVLPRTEEVPYLAASEAIAGGLVILLALASYLPRLHMAHFAEIPVALALVAYAYATSSDPATPASQSDLLACFFILNLAIIPTHAATPPRNWQVA